MQTLHEYMMATKAVEYLISVAFLLAFVVFWKFVSRETQTPPGRKMEK